MRATIDHITLKELDHHMTTLEPLVMSLALRNMQRYGFYGVEPKDSAPSNWEDLIHFMENRMCCPLFPVYTGANDAAIYSPKVNMVFRAWHDITHYDLNADFSLSGELRTAYHQGNQLEALAVARGKPAALFMEILWADTAGQVEFYHATNGGFLTDQKSFVLDCLNYGHKAAIDKAASVIA